MVAFVLSGGANLGAVQVGMVAALYEHGVVPDLLVGTSAGALNAAYLADRPAAVGTASQLGDIWAGLRRSDVFPTSPVSTVLGIGGVRDHLVSNAHLRTLIESHVRSERVEDTRIPLHIVTADVLSGQEVLLSHGLLADAVLASASIPGVLPPVDVGGRLLADGGLVNNAGISCATALGATTIYVLPAGHACALDHPPRGALAMTLHAITLLIQRQLISDIETYRERVRLIVMPPPCPLDVAPGDFSRARELISRSEREARRFLADGGEDREPIRMRMHRHEHATKGLRQP